MQSGTPTSPGSVHPAPSEAPQRLSQETIARLTHDLRTPLNSIIGFSDLLLTGIGGKLTAKQLEFIDAIHRNGHVLLSLINDMLDWSTIESGHHGLRLEPVELVGLVRDLKSMTVPVIASAGITAQWPDESLLGDLTLRIDRKRILQLLLNLIDNARKFTPTGGSIALQMRSETDQLVLVVEDSGPGIPANEIERVFTPYAARTTLSHQRLSDRIPGSHGTGLGLSIVRAIVTLHGGTIRVDRGVLGGARFTVLLPKA